MILYRPRKEPESSFCEHSGPTKGGVAFQSVMTRHSLQALYQDLPQRHVIAPRFLPVGVYRPLVNAGKVVHFYDVPNDLEVPENDILNLGLDPSDTVIHYIHQFGLFVARNIDRMKQLQKLGYYILDDRSLSLPTSAYEHFGNATAYSYYKLVGIPYGGRVLANTAELHVPDQPTDQDEALIAGMTRQFNFYTNPAVARVPTNVFRGYNKVFSRFVEYGHLVAATMGTRRPHIHDRVTSMLDSIDFDAVSKRRAEIAARLYNEIHPRYMLPLSSACYTSQSFMAFPLLVNNAQGMLKHLVRKGITTTRFINIWWWDPTRPPNDLYNRNIVIPAHHGLSESNIDHIIAAVNSFNDATSP